MKYSVILLGFCLLVLSACDNGSLPVDNESVIAFDDSGARSALNYINYIRHDPTNYSDSTGINMSFFERASQLVMNDTLNEVAYQKAKDMIRREYFSHTDPDGKGINIKLHEQGYTLRDEWIASIELNDFESIDAGLAGDEYYAREFVNRLIRDESSETKENRKRILGIGEFNAGMTEFGAAIARCPGSEHENYFVLIIAKHN